MPELNHEDFLTAQWVGTFDPQFIQWGTGGTAGAGVTVQEAVRHLDATFTYNMPKKKAPPIVERKYEIRVVKSKDGKQTLVRCVITNEGDRVLDEWIAVSKDEILDGIARMHEMVANNNSRPTNLRLRATRAKGHLNRDERMFMRSTKEDIEKEDQFELDINAEEIERAEKEQKEKEDRELDETLKAYVPF